MTLSISTVRRPRAFAMGLGVALVSIWCAPPRAQAAPLLGGSWSTPTLFDVSTTTGTASNPRALNPPGNVNLAGLTLSPGGTLFGLAYTGGVESTRLISINPVTGAQVLVGPTNLTSVFEGDLDFNPVNGRLFGIQNVPGTYQMFEINPATGQGFNVTTLSGTTFSDLSAMTFSATGTLHMVDTGTPSRLLTVNPATGVVTNVVNLSADVGDVAGMDFDPDTGILYLADGNTGSTNSLYTVNVATGALSLVGITRVGGLSSLTFIPEPGAAAALAVPALLAVLRRRR